MTIPATTGLVAWLRSGLVATLLTNMVLLLSGIVTSVMVSRALGPDGRGEYVTWHTWAATIALVALGGLPQAVVLDRSVSGRHLCGDLVHGLTRTFLAATVATLAAVVIVQPGWTVAIGALFVATTTQLYAVAAAAEQRMGQMTIGFNAVRILPQIAAILMMLGLLAGGSTSPQIWLLMVAVGQAISLFSWFTPAVRREGLMRRTNRLPFTGSLKLAPGNWAGQMQQGLDLLAVTVICLPDAVAFYAIGVAAQGAVVAAGQAIGMDWFARFRNRDGTRSRKIGAPVRRAAVISITAAIPIAGASGIWVPVAYGEAFTPAIPVVVVLCVVGVMRSVDYLLSHECLMAGKGSRIPLYRLPGLALMLGGFGLAAIFSWSQMAIALISGLGYAVSSTVLWRVTSLRHGSPNAGETAAPAFLTVR